MSAKPCKGPNCKKLVVFGKDVETKKWQVMSNQAVIWKIVGVKDGVTWVQRDTKALLSHFENCVDANNFSSGKKEDPPQPDRHYSEPATAE